MLLVIELALLSFGLFALATGKVAVGKGKKLKGTRARQFGLMLMAPFPLAAVAMFTLVQCSFVQIKPAEDILLYSFVCEVAAIAVCCIVAAALCRKAEAEPAETVEANALASE